METYKVILKEMRMEFLPFLKQVKSIKKKTYKKYLWIILAIVSLINSCDGKEKETKQINYYEITNNYYGDSTFKK